jgi:hypothetical protein
MENYLYTQDRDKYFWAQEHPHPAGPNDSDVPNLS